MQYLRLESAALCNTWRYFTDEQYCTVPEALGEGEAVLNSTPCSGGHYCDVFEAERRDSDMQFPKQRGVATKAVESNT